MLEQMADEQIRYGDEPGARKYKPLPHNANTHRHTGEGGTGKAQETAGVTVRSVTTNPESGSVKNNINIDTKYENI